MAVAIVIGCNVECFDIYSYHGKYLVTEIGIFATVRNEVQEWTAMMVYRLDNIKQLTSSLLNQLYKQYLLIAYTLSIHHEYDYSVSNWPQTNLGPVQSYK